MILCLSLLTGASVARADEPAKPKEPEEPKTHDYSLGPFGGLGVAGGGSSMTFGLTFDYHPVGELLGGGVHYEYLGLSAAAGNGGANLMMFLGELNLYVPKVPALYVSAKAGLGVASPGSLGTTNGASNLTVGGGVGYSYPVLPVFALGLEGNVFYATGAIGATIGDVYATFRFLF